MKEGIKTHDKSCFANDLRTFQGFCQGTQKSLATPS